VPNTFSASGIWGIALTKDGRKLVTGGDGPYGGPIYLLQPMPVLSVAATRTNIVVFWPSWASGFVLQQTTDDLRSPNWSDLATLPEIANGMNQIKFASQTNNQFFRLQFPTGNPPYWWPYSPPPIIGF